VYVGRMNDVPPGALTHDHTGKRADRQAGRQGKREGGRQAIPIRT